MSPKFHEPHRKDTVLKLVNVLRPVGVLVAWGQEGRDVLHIILGHVLHQSLGGKQHLDHAQQNAETLNPSFRSKFTRWFNSILVTAGVLNVHNFYQEPSGHKNLGRPVQTRETSRKKGTKMWQSRVLALPVETNLAQSSSESRGNIHSGTKGMKGGGVYSQQTSGDARDTPRIPAVLWRALGCPAAQMGSQGSPSSLLSQLGRGW